MDNKNNMEQFKQYSLPPINGTQFSGQLGNRINFEIPATHFIKGREDFRLNFKLLNTSASKQRLGVSPTAGANSCINRIDFFNLSGVLLESLQNYNQICSIINQYNYNDANNINSLMGVSVDNVARKFTGDADTHVAVPNSKSMNNSEDLILSPVDEAGQAKYNPVLFSLDVKAGLLAAFDKDEKLLPLPFLNGLRVVVYLEQPEIALVNVSGVGGEDLISDGLDCLPNAALSDHVFIQGSGDFSCDDVPGNQDFVKITSTAVTLLNIPYVVGDLVTVEKVDPAAPGVVIRTACKIASMVDDGGQVKINLTQPDGTAVVIPLSNSVKVRFTTSNVTVQNCGFAVGNVCDIVSTTDPIPAGYPSQNKTITAIAFDNTEGKVKVTLGANDVPAGGTDLKLRLKTADKSYSVEPTLQIMSVLAPNPPPVKDFKFQFCTYDFYINTIPSTSRNFQIEIPSVSTMGKAIFTTYANANKLQDNENSNLFVGQFPEESNIDSVQYYINNKYYPVRAYNPQVTKEKVINQHELQKALHVINREPENMGFNDGANLNDYTCQYLHALRLASGDFIYNLAESEPQIRLGFSAVRTFNMNAYSFVFCNKIINVDSQGVSILQ
jgi:hypothetical protein